MNTTGANRQWMVGWVILVVGIVVGGAARGQDAADPACFDNAAWSYWKAQAKLQPILSPEHLDAVLFAETRLNSLPPKAFAYRPELGRWLIQEKGMLTELHRAASLPYCAFNPLPEAGVTLDLSHREVLRDLWQRALAAAKAFEFVDQYEGAVTVYLDLFSLLDHLDDDEDWASAYVAVTWLPELAGALEGFFSRLPPRLAVQPLADYLGQRRQTPVYPMRQFMKREMRTYAGWLMEDPAQMERRLASLYRGRPSMPAVEELLGLEGEAKREKLVEWLRGYETEVGHLATSLEKPYAQAMEAVLLSDQRILSMAEYPALPGTNPLLPLLMPPMERTYQEFVASEATYALLDALAIASIYRDFVGDWPDDIPMIEQFGNRTLPLDPFTGEHIGYTVRNGMPRMDVAIPSWLEEKGSVFALADLALRVENDDAALNRLIREVNEKMIADERQAGRAAVAGGGGRSEDDAGARARESERLRRAKK